MKRLRVFIFMGLLLMCLGVNAQEESKTPPKHFLKETLTKLKPTPWILGIGWNVVDDDGHPTKNLFSSKSLNMTPYLSTLRAEKYVAAGFSGVFYFAYNNFQAGKFINSDLPANASSNFMCYDLEVKYNLCTLYDINLHLFGMQRQLFDIYFATGMGYTFRAAQRVPDVTTYNFGLGSNIWLTRHWGVNLQGMAKLGLTTPLFRTPANYLQYSFGVVYGFNLSASGGDVVPKPQF
jgi:hypothetical protein